MRDGFAHVAVLQPDHRVQLVRVQTGRLNGNRVEVTTALPAGAQVVVRGAGFLNDGDAVQVVAEPATAAPASAPISAAASAPNQPAALAQPAQAASK